MNRTITTLLFLLVTLTWGTTWMAMTLALATIPPIFATGLRFSFAAPFLLLIAIICRAPLLFPRELRCYQAYITAFYFAIPFSLINYGEQYVSSGLAALIFSTMPAIILVLSVCFLHEALRPGKILGLFACITALGAIILTELDWTESNSLKGIAALLCAAVLHALVYTISKKQCSCISVLTFNALPCTCASVLLLSIGWIFEHPSVRSFSQTSIGAAAFLGVVSGVFGILSYFSLQQRTTPFKASLAFVIFPVVAICIEDLSTGKSLHPISYVFFALLTTGVLLVLLPSMRTTTSGSMFKARAITTSEEQETVR